MKVEIKKLSKLKRQIKIEVDSDEFLKEKNEVYKKSAKGLKVPGFRPGTAPMDIIEKKHSNFLKDEFLKTSLPVFYSKALQEHKIIPASMPRIYDVDLGFSSVVFFAELEIKPELEIKETVYKKIKIKTMKMDVTDSDIKKVITNLKDGIKKVINKDLDDEELARWASYPNFANLKDAVKGQLGVEKLRERRQKIEQQIRESLLKSVNVDLPQDEVDRHHKELVNREAYNLQFKGLSKEDIDKYKVELQDKFKPAAFDEVKLFYILEAIAKKESIKIDNNLGDIIFGFILSQAQYA